jgi:hypothetical protein
MFGESIALKASRKKRPSEAKDGRDVAWQCLYNKFYFMHKPKLFSARR